MVRGDKNDPALVIMKPTSRSSAYRPDIDGLRAISIIAVLGYHGFGSLLPGGFVGVDVFFVISGYLITGLILTELREERFSFWSFYARRIRRIFPALAVVLIAVYIGGWNILFPAELAQLGKHIVGAAAFASNFVLLNEVGYFDIGATAKPLLHLWSLGIEEQFYLFWPLFAWFLWQKKWNQPAATLGLLVVSFALNIYLSPDAAAFYLPFSRLWELAAGALIVQLQRAEKGSWADWRSFWATHPEWIAAWLRHCTGFSGIALICGATYVTPLAKFPGWWALMPVVGAALIILSGPTGWLNRRILANPVFVFVGLISYSLYLWHWPLISFAWIIYARRPPAEVVFVLLIVSFILACLTYAFVERPIRFGIRPGVAVGGLVTTILAIVGVGLWTVHANGIESRSVAQANRQLARDLTVPAKTRRSDGSCQRYFGIDMKGDEVCLASSDRPRLLIVGDSHSMAMYSAIYAGLVHANAALLATHSDRWARPECLKRERFEDWVKGSSPCQVVVRNTLDLLAREPSIEAVVFVTTPFNPFFGDNEKVGAFQRAILAQHRRLVYVKPVPILMPPSHCRVRHLEILGIDVAVEPLKDECRQKVSFLAKFEETWTRHIDAMARGNKDVFIYDPSPSFCDAEYCYQSDSKGLLFWLTGHVNIRGSARLLAGFLPWVKEQVLKHRSD